MGSGSGFVKTCGSGAGALGVLVVSRGLRTIAADDGGSCETGAGLVLTTGCCGGVGCATTGGGVCGSTTFTTTCSLVGWGATVAILCTVGDTSCCCGFSIGRVGIFATMAGAAARFTCCLATYFSGIGGWRKHPHSITTIAINNSILICNMLWQRISMLRTAFLVR